MSNPNPTPFAKTGAAANPNGRPKKEWTWAGLLEEAMEEELVTTDGRKDKVKKFITKRLVKMAIDGDIAAQKEIMNRMDGMPRQSTDLTSGGKPIQNPLIISTIIPRHATTQSETTEGS